MQLSYHEQVNINNIQKVRTLIQDLPVFAEDFFRALHIDKSTNTMCSYAYDLNTFFFYLKEKHPAFQDKDIRKLPVTILDEIIPVDIEKYMEFLLYYEKDGQIHTNENEGKARKLATLNSFFGYYFKKGYIKSNPPSAVDVPRVKEKAIIRLEPNEVAILIDSIESGENLTGRQIAWHTHTKFRDLAIIVTLLGTGLRVAELVGIDLKDVDFDNLGLRVIRKGGKEDIVYFGSEVEEVLQNYMYERKKITPAEGHENALFLSREKTRMSIRSVERLVKKYASPVTAKHITPHKMRATHGTSLYQETGDIYLVADVLGHSNVNTTRKHYAAMKEENKRRAANAVKLRSDK